LTEGQYRNIIKVIVVAALSKQFRKAKIVERVVRNIKKDKLVATGELSMPKLTASLLPSDDDRFLINRNSVVVKIMRMSQYGKQYPMAVSIGVNIRYGLNEQKYQGLVEGTPYRGKGVPEAALMNWISAKKGKSRYFRNPAKGFYVSGTSKGKTRIYKYNENIQWHRDALRYIINMSIKYSEYKSDFLKPFDDPKKGVRASIEKAKPEIALRIAELYGTQLRSFAVDALNISLG
jgi:hypothetical protein